jgi:hypothetical protein
VNRTGRARCSKGWPDRPDGMESATDDDDSGGGAAEARRITGEEGNIVETDSRISGESSTVRGERTEGG